MKLILEDSVLGRKEVDYANLSVKELERKIKTYEKKYRSLQELSKQYHCDESNWKIYVNLVDFENLIAEVKRRRGRS